MCSLHITRDGNSLVALQDTTMSDIWVSNPDGTSPRQITSGEALSSGVDWVGNRIVAGDSRGQWVSMNTDGSGRAPMFGDHDPRIQLNACLDAKHVIYTTFHNGTLALWRSEPDGSNAAMVTPRPRAVLGGFCTPDSKPVVYVGDGSLCRVPI